VSAFDVETVSLAGGATALGWSGGTTLVIDRPNGAGGRGLGFNGGQLMYASIAACVSNDLYREAATMGIALTRVSLTVVGEFPGRGQPSGPVTVEVELEGTASDARLDELMAVVDEVAEIPNSMRGTTPIEIRRKRS
jgi:organic hydroperoxide reductase OsmC/OhrA